MADTKKKRRRTIAKRNRPKDVARQRKSLNRSKRPVLKWNSRSRHGVFVRPVKPAPKPAKAAVKTAKPAAKAAPLEAAKASVAAKAAQKTAPKPKESTDGVTKAKSQPSNLRDARPHEKPEPPSRPSGSVHKETGQKGPQKQVKKSPGKG